MRGTAPADRLLQALSFMTARQRAGEHLLHPCQPMRLLDQQRGQVPIRCMLLCVFGVGGGITSVVVSTIRGNIHEG